MAPAPLGDSVYFPPLDKLLSGEYQLLSWKTVLTGLSDRKYVANSTNLRRFLSDQEVVRLLSRPFDTFRSPTSQTKSSFETRTAAINVTPTTQGHYDIKEIKDDSLWLSKESGIDEVSALRIAILEWQTRPAIQLLSGFSEEESATVQSAAGGASLGSSIFLPSSSILSATTTTQGTDPTAFNSTESRRVRLLRQYLSERRYVLRVSELLIRAGLSPQFADVRSPSANNDERHSRDWIQELGKAAVKACGVGAEPRKDKKEYLVELVEALQARISNLENGSGWFADEGGKSEIEDRWGRNQIVEMMHIMQLVFIFLDHSTTLPSSGVVLSWLRLMSKYNFFEQFEPLYPSQQALLMPFQSLISITSLVILKLSHAMAHLYGPSDQPVPAADLPDSSPYLLNPTTINEVNAILLDAASASLAIASPIVYAWGIILQTLRGEALSRKEVREVRQSQRAVDGFAASESETEGGDSSATESGSGTRPSRRTSGGSDISIEPSVYEEILDTIMDTALEEDPILYLAKSAVNGCHVYDVITSLATQCRTAYASNDDNELALTMRISLLDLIRMSLTMVNYLPEVIQSVLAVLTGFERYWESADRQPANSVIDPVSVFLGDELLKEKLLYVALSRFPYESLPFLKLCRALATSNVKNDEPPSFILQMLQGMTSFTQVIPQTFRGYELVREDENVNVIMLTQGLRLFTGRKSLDSGFGDQSALVLAGDGSSAETFTIPVGTFGRVISDSKPLVTVWEHQYSGLSYLGRALETALSRTGYSDQAIGFEVDRETVTEIVGLFTVLIQSSVKHVGGSHGSSAAIDAAQRILEEASDALGRNRDIISVIFDIFEGELQGRQSASAGDGSLELLINCVQFVQAVVPVLPGRVWPFLARSTLLEIDGRGGQLASIVASAEMVTGRYDFLIGCVRIFDSLVDDAIIHAVARKSAVKAPGRFKDAEAQGTGVPDRSMSKVLLTFERTMVGVLESLPNWRFAVLEDRLEINTRITTTFTNILQYSYGIDDTTDSSKKINAVLAPSAEYLLDIFLSPTSNDLPLQPLLKIFYEGLGTPNSTLFLCNLEFWTAQVRSVLDFSTMVIQVGRLLKSPTSHLQRQLFKASPLLARLYAAHETYKLPVASLFEALVSSAASTDDEPPSLLGHLGPETAKHFLSVLSSLDRPLDDLDLDVCIWNLLSAVVSCRQQWFAIYLLTGSTPRDSLKKEEGSGPVRSLMGRPLLTVALDALSEVHSLHPRRALAMLEFVALAEDYWPWAMTDLHKHPTFLTAILNFVGSLASDRTLHTPSRVVEKCDKTRMASFIAEILAMYMHHSRQMGDISFAKKVATNLTYFTDNAVTVPGYNTSLHANLRRNFEMKFPGCSLLSFKRTLLQRKQFGREYFYDLELAGKMLSFDRAWTGPKNQGFAEEVARANVNLSVVESQVFLLHGWKFLAMELSSILSSEIKLQKSMAKVVGDCLKSNSETNLPETIFGRLVQLRADFAFVLMQRLVEVNSRVPEVQAILAIAWNTIRISNTSLELSLTSGDAEYTRTLLKILFLALCPHLPDTTSQSSRRESVASISPGAKTASPETVRTVVEILRVVVGNGFRSLSNILHDDPKQSSPADFALITAILQTALRIPGVQKLHNQIVANFCDCQVARYATTLFSWSDQLCIDNDPIYGELSILFLFELSSIPTMAEQLAVEGVLAHLSSANLMNYFRRSTTGIGPFDPNNNNSNRPRLYAIWTRGILPLCLNLLTAVGGPLAAEIATFLNQFPTQLARAANAFDTKPVPTAADPTAGCITLGMASEVHSLALISVILDTFRAAGAAAAVVASDIAELKWDRAQVKDDIEGWLEGRRGLRDRIVATNEREVELARQKPSTGSTSASATAAVATAENRLEERVVAELDSALGCLSGERE
ncbi:MAG: hypothetical protein M1819_001374 [Sarea resinae]|nr:MAG: hypothetical protein M1819_001374 [Sarea resinae]